MPPTPSDLWHDASHLGLVKQQMYQATATVAVPRTHGGQERLVSQGSVIAAAVILESGHHHLNRGWSLSETDAAATSRHSSLAGPEVAARYPSTQNCLKDPHGGKNNP